MVYVKMINSESHSCLYWCFPSYVLLAWLVPLRKSTLLESLNFTYTPNGKRQIQVEQIKTPQKILLDKKMRETTNFCVEIMNSRREVTWSRGTNSRLPFDVNVMLNLSIVVVIYFADYVN